VRAKESITVEEIAAIAAEIAVPVAALRAVLDVETRGVGFLADGRPIVLFERHWFHRLTKGQHAGATDVSSRQPGGYAIGPTPEARGQREWERLARAAQLDWDAAMMSASWGLPQILGVNYRQCLCATIEEFVTAMQESERRQVELLAEFLRSRRLLDELRRQDWAGFARQYNGPLYRQNRYDEKLAEAFARFNKE
jgi:hypothetical protein